MCCQDTVTYTVDGWQVTNSDKVYVSSTSNLPVGDYSIQVSASLDGGLTLTESPISVQTFVLRLVDCSETLESLYQIDQNFPFSPGSSHQLSELKDWAVSSDPEYCQITACHLQELDPQAGMKDY